MESPLVLFEGAPYVVFRRTEDWGVRALDLAALPRRLWGPASSNNSVLRRDVDLHRTKPLPTPAELLTMPLAQDDTWTAMSKRTIARLYAFFLVGEDPQRRLDAREVETLAHQVSMVRHVLDSPNLRRVLIADEVGLGKTVVVGLILKELLAAMPGLRVLYLAPARLVSNVAREFSRLELGFRQWKTGDGDARFDTDRCVIASIHRAIHPNHRDQILKLRPWDVIVVDECHHLSAWGEDGTDPVQKYRLVEALSNAQPADGRLILLSGTPHQAHVERFKNLLRLLCDAGQPLESTKGRVVYRTKEDVRDWSGKRLFPPRMVRPPIVIDLGSKHQQWLAAIYQYFNPVGISGSEATRRAAGWKCAQALQWAASSPNAGLGYLVRQALRAGWRLEDAPLEDAIAAMRPYRLGSPTEPVAQLYKRLHAEVRYQPDADEIADIEPLPEDAVGGPDAGLAELIRDGIALARSAQQPKWQKLWESALGPSEPEKIVLFAQPIETVMALATWLERTTGTRPALIVGGQSDGDRDREVGRFRDDPQTRFLISSKAGGEGINLQFARRLVHLDVPWNPMDMEQRVGRVHRFGSRHTVIVETLVAKQSREMDAWRVARERLETVARSVVSPDRFDTVFARVMCLIPPDDLQAVLLGGQGAPLSDEDSDKLSQLVAAGFDQWKSFHEAYSENQKRIRDQPCGLAQWRHLGEFLLDTGCAEEAETVTRFTFDLEPGDAHPASEAERVIRLRDGSRRLVGDYAGGLLANKAVGPLGLNVQLVAEALQDAASPSSWAGAAYLRWKDRVPEFGVPCCESSVFLVFHRQAIQYGAPSGDLELGSHMLAFACDAEGYRQLPPAGLLALLDAARDASVRMKPVEAELVGRCQEIEAKILAELKRPTEDQRRDNQRYVAWPVAAVFMSR